MEILAMPEINNQMPCRNNPARHLIRMGSGGTL